MTITRLLIPAVLLSASLCAAPALANDSVFFERVQGSWVGPGEVVAGKYKGTKFTCTLKGAATNSTAGMLLDGSCRVGVFTQKMSAKVERRGRGYKGKFLDGAEGNGLDIVSGNVDGQRVVFALNRNQLNGAMSARLPDENTLNVTVSVQQDKKLIPVIGMQLKRTRETASNENPVSR